MLQAVPVHSHPQPLQPLFLPSLGFPRFFFFFLLVPPANGAAAAPEPLPPDPAVSQTQLRQPGGSSWPKICQFRASTEIPPNTGCLPWGTACVPSLPVPGAGTMSPCVPPAVAGPQVPARSPQHHVKPANFVAAARKFKKTEVGGGSRNKTALKVSGD